MSSTRSSSPKAPVTDPQWRAATLLLCAHGVRGRAGVARDHAAAIAALECFANVDVCCLHGQSGLEEALDRISTECGYIVPLLMAEGRTSGILTEQVLTADVSQSVSMKLCRPVGCHSGMADLIIQKTQNTCLNRSWRSSETGLVLIGHGTPRHAHSSRSLRRHCAHIAKTRPFAEVRCAFLDDSPRVPEALKAMTTARTVAVGFFADAGPHGADDVGRLLAGHAHDVAYAGPVGCDPGLVDLILDQVRQADDAILAA